MPLGHAVLSRAPGLSPREREVLQLRSTGLTYVQIAKRMAISRHTVDSYLRRIREKTGARSGAELTRLAVVLEMLEQIENDERATPPTGPQTNGSTPLALAVHGRGPAPGLSVEPAA